MRKAFLEGVRRLRADLRIHPDARQSFKIKKEAKLPAMSHLKSSNSDYAYTNSIHSAPDDELFPCASGNISTRGIRRKTLANGVDITCRNERTSQAAGQLAYRKFG